MGPLYFIKSTQVNKKEIFQILPLVIVAGLSIFSLIEVLTSNYRFMSQSYIGVSLVAISSFLYFTNRKLYKIIFGTTLLLGLLGVVSFTTSITKTRLIIISLQLIVLPSATIFAIIHKEEIIKTVRKIFGKDEVMVKAESNSQIHNFKRRFEKLSDIEIERKLNQNLTHEAIKALEKIKESRRINNKI